MSQELELLPADLASPLWHALKTHLEDRLQSLRTQLETDQPPEKTANLRGRIAEVKRILSLGESKRRPPIDA